MYKLMGWINRKEKGMVSACKLFLHHSSSGNQRHLVNLLQDLLNLLCVSFDFLDLTSRNTS